MKTSNILLIYTGGTIGMKQDPATGALTPFDFSHIIEEMPELQKFGYVLDSYSFEPVIDSSDVSIEFWQTLAHIIENNYLSYDGFVVLHGTDTMSYSASALSFMLEDLEKPVIFTGSQLPIGMLRTDGKENLISSIEIAAAKRADGKPMVPEVCIYFESQLYRGNRTTKYSAENFRAFKSANYPVLADVGIHIKYNVGNIKYPEKWGKRLKARYNLSTDVAIIRIVPGLTTKQIDTIANIDGLRAIILETFGSGNAPTNKQFLDSIEKITKKGILVLNITQCHAGKVDMDAYFTGRELKRVGVIGGYDSTTESMLTKLYYLLGQYTNIEDIKVNIEKNLRGEITKE